MKTVEVVMMDVVTERETVRTFATNNSGCGLFVWDTSGSYQQISGNGQFFARTPAEMMRGIRRHYEKQVVRMVRKSATGWL